MRVSVQQYEQELGKWQSYIESHGDGARPEKPPVPTEWIVESSAGDYHVATDFLYDLTNDEASKLALERIKALRAASISASQPSGRMAARAEATRILSQREFRSVHMPGIKESLSDRLTQFLIHLAEKLFGKAVQNAAAVRTFVTVLTWVLLLGGVSIFCFWLFRMLRGLATQELELEGSPPEFVSSKSPEAWLADAHKAAAHGEYRLAICLAYWAGIAGLERKGAWPPDRARTPREYLRNAVDAPFLPLLRLLTKDFEQTWYAGQIVTDADFESYVSRVKELGWQSS